MHPPLFALRRALTAVFAFVLIPTALCCAQGPPSIKAAAVGFAGVSKAGFWTPVVVDVQGGDQDWRGELLIETPDSDGVPTTFRDARRREVRAGETVRLFGYAKLGRQQTEVTIRLTSADSGVADATQRITLGGARRARSAMQRLYVTLGDSIGIQQALDRRRRSERERNVTVQLDSTAALPDRAIGFDSVTVLAIATSREGLIESLTRDQLAAMGEWVRNGGRMILCAGRRAEIAIGPQGVLREYAPGTLVRVEQQQDTSNLESFVKAREQLPPFTMAMLDEPRGVLVEDLRVRDRLEQIRPVILRTPYGFGDVVFIACDLDLPPLSNWIGRSGLVDAVLRLRSGRIAADAFEPSGRSQYGYIDMSAQLRTAMDQFRDADGELQVANVFFSLVVILIVVYGLLIGPGDYWLLRGLLGRRMQWTWLSFPLVIVACCSLVLWLNRTWKGDQIRATQCDIVDIDAETGWTRGATMAHVFTPASGLLDVQLISKAPAELQQLGRHDLVWQGAPGSALGGLDSTTLPLFDQAYRIEYGAASQAAILGVPVGTGGSRSFVGHWNATTSLGRSSYLFDSNGRLDGELANPLNVTLRDCILMYGNWSYRLDAALAPGQTIPVAALTHRDLEWRLTRRRVAREDATFTMAPWDAGDQDIARIVEIMMFHAAAGGDSYTQLPNEYLGRLDLSRLLRSGRAILLGKAEGVGATLQSGDRNLSELAEGRLVFCRVVLPVLARKRASTRDAPQS